jgi:hypothetical protein
MRFLVIGILALTLSGCSMTALEREFTSANLSDWQHCKARAVGYVSPSGVYVPGFLKGASPSTVEAHTEFLDAAIARAKAADDLAAKGGK